MWIVVAGSRVPVSALNVSVGGAAVHTSARAEVGAVVGFEAELAGAPGFILEAEVVRVEEGVLGLRFLALGQRALEALVATQAPSVVSAAEARRAEAERPSESRRGV